MPPPPDVTAKNNGPRLQKIALVSKLDISRPTLDKYLHMEGAPEIGADRCYDVEEVVKWIEAHAPQVGKNATLNDLKAQKLRLECEKLRHQIEVQKGDYIAKRDAADAIIPVMQELGSLLTQTFELELPSRYVGHDAVDCAKMNADALDKIIKRFKHGLRGFTE